MARNSINVSTEQIVHSAADIITFFIGVLYNKLAFKKIKMCYIILPMTRLSTRTIENIDRKLESTEEGSARHKVLSSAKSFKTSWFDLGQSLYSVWRDRLYKEWGYATFDAYTSKEIGIKKPTAMKLLKSYYFLEKEEPNYVERAAVSPENPASVPTYDAINLLRLAKNKKTLDGGDYAHLRREVLEMGREASLVKTQKKDDHFETARHIIKIIKDRHREL
ncbi:MAG: hypothetical protein NTZ95_04285 [Candidatus Omnitrophica bacterium]|nr:hypothetical protein [Candidatus Omnitrophota bacterium]